MALLSIVAVKILTTYLGKNLYGEYNTVYIYLAFFSIIADLGIYTIAVREMSRKEDQVPVIIGNILSIRTFLAVLSIGTAVLVAFFIPQYRDTFVPIGILISGVGTVIALVNGVLVSVFQTYLKMQYATLSLVIGKVISVLGLVIIAFWLLPREIIENDAMKTSWAFYATITVGIISSLAMVMVTLFYSKKLVKITYQFDIKVWKKLMQESLPFGIALILGTIYIRVDGFLLSLLKDSEEVGIYTVATKVIEVINVLPILFMSTVLPVLTKFIETKSEKTKELLKHSFTFLYSMAVPILTGLFVLAYQVIYIIATPEFLTRLEDNFYGSDIALKILSISLFVSFINNLFIYLLVSTDQQKKLLWINGSAVLLNVILNFLVIPIWGFRGASMITVLSEVLVLCLTFYHSRKVIRFNLDYAALIKITISGVMMGIILAVLKEPIIAQFQNKGILFLFVLGAVLYSVFLLLTKAITKEHLRLLLKKE